MKILCLLAVGMILAAGPAGAHHSPVVYNGKVTVEITGTVTSARFGFPHSRYLIEVADEDGATERWTLMTEDPRDAEILGFADELKAIEKGDTITVVGWPNKIKPREIRGHQLLYPDGSVVMMRRGNYIWTKDLRRIWRLRDGQIEYPPGIESMSADRSPIDRVTAWIAENDPAARVAREIVDGSAALIGVDRGAGLEFAGVREDFRCHVDRENFRLEIDATAQTDADRERLREGAGYIGRYNDLLATYWEYDIESCE